MRKGILLTIFLLPELLNAQKLGDFSVEYGFNLAQFAMNTAKEYVRTDSTYNPFYPNQKKSFFNDLSTGFHQTFSTHYQISNFLAIGIATNYQCSNLLRTFPHTTSISGPDENGNYKINEGRIENKTESFSVGLSSQLYLNKLLHFEKNKSPILQKITASFGVKGMFGWAKFKEKMSIENYPFGNWSYRFDTQNFNFQGELALSYPLFRKNLFANAGIKIGYQYFSTPTLKNIVDEAIYTNGEPKKEVNLDFGGLYYGVFVQIGK